MRIVRPEHSWFILLPSRRERFCLQGLALKCGYRIGEICGELGCGERYLHSVFQRDVGLSPKDWMRRERMVVARRKLTGGKEPWEVSEDLGFSSPCSFRREFLDFHRVLPIRFQQERWGLEPDPMGIVGRAGIIRGSVPFC